jgi:hypothetical protein
MTLRYVIPALVILGLGLWLFLSFRDGKTTSAEYLDALKKDRAEKDLFMRENDQSPLRGDSAFTGLKYFDADIEYRVVADLEPIHNKKILMLATNDGLQKQYREYAYASFRLKGSTHRLLILEILDVGPFKGTLFLAFADETSALETYGAGRYLDLKKTPGAATVTLDFNRAYNPYCAYLNEFSCPLPPRENILKVAIYAGEKSYH